MESPTSTPKASQPREESTRTLSSPSNPPASSIPHTTCLVCTETLPTSETIRLQCRHHWCHPCLNAGVAHAISARANYPPRCCTDTTAVTRRPRHNTISLAHVQGCLTDAVAAAAAQAFEEFGGGGAASSSSSAVPAVVVHCAAVACGLLIPACKLDGRHDQFVVCRACREETCRRCGCLRVSHMARATTATATSSSSSSSSVSDRDLEERRRNNLPLLCPAEELSEADRALIWDQGWQRCPRCRTMVERDRGCRLVLCLCGTYFCYDCGGTVAMVSRTMRWCACRTALEQYPDDRDSWPGLRAAFLVGLFIAASVVFALLDAAYVPKGRYLFGGSG